MSFGVNSPILYKPAKQCEVADELKRKWREVSDSAITLKEFEKAGELYLNYQAHLMDCDKCGDK